MTQRQQRRIASVFVISIVLCAAATAMAGQSLVTVPLKGPRQIEDLRAQGIEVLSFTKHGFDVLVDDRQLDYLLSRNYPVSAVPVDGPALGTSALDANLGLYHTYAEMESVIADWDTTYTNILDVLTLGTSVEGRTIYGLKISDNPLIDETEPEVLYIGNHHARELMSVDIPLRFAGYLMENYGVDPTITGYIDNREIYFVPMMNPDGHVYVEQNHGGHWGNWWRKNRRNNGDGSFGIDLNRNWGFAWGYDDAGSSPDPGSILYRGPSAFSEPETQALRDFVNSREFTIWLSFHTYGELLLYPWGYIFADTPDHDVFVALGDSLTEANGYFAGNANGGAIYIVNGDSDDWGYGEQISKNKIFAFTPEMNTSAQGGFGPEDVWIQPTFDLNLEMNMRVLEYADNPYKVVGPWGPTQYAVTEPYANAVHRLHWSEADVADPNPTTHYEVVCCETPGAVLDDGTMTSLWNFDGFTVAAGYSGDGYYSGSGDNINQVIEMVEPYVVASPTDTMSFWIDYDIEVDWDYGYVEVSTNGGSSWTSIQGNITTATNPNGNNLGHGITGVSGGYVFAEFPLDTFAGQDILIRIRYVTDAAVIEPGLTVDDIEPVSTCASVEVVAAAHPDTTLDVTPDAVTTYRYRVRAYDAENHVSRWSNSRDYVVTTLTAAGEQPRFRTQLGANYPNPFNPTTTIPFVVGGARDGSRSPVALRVYTVRGELVATLVDGQRAPGTHEAIWTGTNDAGAPMASGIYFAQLVVGENAAVTRKLLLLK